ncbi:hypothetical protein DL769_003833 [Monosporascus sp. CRB-8-3]|nr:hypothetical protein DL769_003833 [Monosporascus sp. CRB-8-3]
MSSRSRDQVATQAPEVDTFASAPEVTATTTPYGPAEPAAGPLDYKGYGYEYGDSGGGRGQNEKRRQGKRICGLPAPAFAVLIILAVAIVLGAGLGAGLGVGLRASESEEGSNAHPDAATGSAATTISASESSPATTVADGTAETEAASRTASATTSAVTSGTTGIAATSCTDGNPREYASGVDSVTFTVHCFANWRADTELLASDDSSGGAVVEDITSVWQYTLESCMDACATWNQNRPGTDAQYCRAVHYNWNLTHVSSTAPKEGKDYNTGNCWFKNGPGRVTDVKETGANAELVS